MPSRMLRDGILTSDRVNALSLGAEVLYRRLMSVVDDYGRFDGRTAIVRAACYPLRIDAVSEAEIDGWIAECADVRLLARYEVDGRQYLALADFKQRIRGASKWPAPPGCRDTAAGKTELQQLREAGVA